MLNNTERERERETVDMLGCLCDEIVFFSSLGRVILMGSHSSGGGHNPHAPLRYITPLGLKVPAFWQGASLPQRGFREAVVTVGLGPQTVSIEDDGHISGLTLRNHRRDQR